ncbi:hypothetical protein T492DRAFT_912173 [Pavlovales sp. CCMP2436]|nr:hypothetical protein T492DRAFT_912173 [Pavlovales sp. CCMP2436]
MDEEIVEEGRLQAAISFVLGVPPSWCSMAVIATADDGPSRVRALVAVPAAARESALDLAVKFRTFFTTRPGAFEELLGNKVQAAEMNLEDGDPLPLVTIIPPTDRHDQNVGGTGEETTQQLLPDSQPGDTQLVVQPIDTQYSIDNDGSLIFAAYLVGLITVVCIVKVMERLCLSRAVHPAAPLMGEAEKWATLQLLLPGGERSHAGRAEGTHQLERLTREAALELESLALVGERSAPPEAAAAAVAAAAPAVGAQAAIAARPAVGAGGGADEASHALSAERGERAVGAAGGGASAAEREELEFFLSAGVPMRYQSPLHALKTYRLTRPARTGAEPHSFLVSVPAGAVAEPLSGAGATHTLRPEVPLCRYDLLGTCNVQGCTQEHSRSYLASVPALCDVQDAALAAATLERAALALVDAASSALAPAPLAELRLAMRLEVSAGVRAGRSADKKKLPAENAALKGELVTEL